MSGRRRPSPASKAEPETLLTRAALVMVLGAVVAGSSQEGWLQVGGATSQMLLIGGCLLMAGGVVATLRALYGHGKGRGQ